MVHEKQKSKKIRFFLNISCFFAIFVIIYNVETKVTTKKEK